MTQTAPASPPPESVSGTGLQPVVSLI